MKSRTKTSGFWCNFDPYPCFLPTFEVWEHREVFGSQLPTSWGGGPYAKRAPFVFFLFLEAECFDQGEKSRPSHASLCLTIEPWDLDTKNFSPALAWSLSQ